MFKRKVGLKDCYDAAVFLWRALFRRRRIDKRFAERPMLAVTEVNGCAACSYAHTGMALAQGMPRKENEAFLSASDVYVVPDEASAILFARHYADSGARPEAVRIRPWYPNTVRKRPLTFWPPFRSFSSAAGRRIKS